MAIAHLPPSRALAVLDCETAQHHPHAEADLFHVLDDPTLNGYRRFLTRIFHFESAVESRLARTPQLPEKFIAARLKTGRLAEDLHALGGTTQVDPRFATAIGVPHFTDARDALGWFYVLQRNTLHHQGLYRALAPRLRATLQCGSRYLTMHAGDVYLRWHELGACLDRFAGDLGMDRVVAAAHDGFRLQQAWYARATLQSTSLAAAR